MHLPSPRGPLPARARHRRWRAALGTALVAALGAAGAVGVGAAPAHAQDDCLQVRYEAQHWTSSPGTGGSYATITLTNTCAAPVSGWSVALTLAPGHTFDHGWNATWTARGSQVTASALSWNATVRPDGSVTVGYLGSWTGSPQDPAACTVNGAVCAGWPAPPPPAGELRVALTGPPDGGIVPGMCPIHLTADAGAAEGRSVDRVEFYVNGRLVGTDRTAPYHVEIPGNDPSLIGIRHSVQARVVDDGDPPADLYSVPHTFSIAPIPPALMVVACPSRVDVVEGHSRDLTFVTACQGTPGLELTVTADPGVTISPLSTPPGTRLHRVTATAAPGSAGATATIRADAVDGQCLPATATVTVVPASG